VYVALGSGCAVTDGAFDGRVNRSLTEDVVYWALSPGWSRTPPTGVPFPHDLRRN
jgi:hypothetical protein